MTDTDFLRSDALPGRAALGYVEVEGQWRTNVFHLPVVATGDGGMYTTSADTSAVRLLRERASETAGHGFLRVRLWSGHTNRHCPLLTELLGENGVNPPA